jgi:hypothetical protein
MDFPTRRAYVESDDRSLTIIRRDAEERRRTCCFSESR